MSRNMNRVQGVEHIHGIIMFLCLNHHFRKKKNQQTLSVGKVPELTAVNYILYKCAVMTLIFSCKMAVLPICVIILFRPFI